MKDNFKFKTNIRVIFSDTDMAGVVNNINFFRYFEAARIEYFRAAGIAVMDVIKSGLEAVMVHQECDYRLPVYFDEILEVGVRTSEIRETSFATEYRLWRKENGDEVAAGKTVHVMIDIKNRKPCPVPEWVREHFLNFDKA
ncbi:MAG: thioesterase family protein [bacterium]